MMSKILYERFYIEKLAKEERLAIERGKCKMEVEIKTLQGEQQNMEQQQHMLTQQLCAECQEDVQDHL